MATAAPSIATQLIQLAPDVKESHTSFSDSYQTFFNAVFNGGALDPKTKAAVALASALLLGREETVRSFLATAKQLGLGNEEIGQVAGIVEVLKLDAAQRPAQAPAAAPAKANTCC
ncbi:carboxymuconolactone decarboxylase family protein [Herbidospora mongoliensis]|uniref:carboxymuconolactone decarboxylase family protein n=1 Tax=Herbidospora mongoliensis TaxID=688067 RepID=UPI00082B6663|nr:carboxymuconolactone decarboxylase family protein [Herbidospora mongoliensis]